MSLECDVLLAAVDLSLDTFLHVIQLADKAGRLYQRIYALGGAGSAGPCQLSVSDRHRGGAHVARHHVQRNDRMHRYDLLAAVALAGLGDQPVDLAGVAADDALPLEPRELVVIQMCQKSFLVFRIYREHSPVILNKASSLIR